MANIMAMGKNPNYLGAYDLYDLNIKEITVTIKKIVEEDVITNGKTEKCAVAYFEENYKPMILNPTNKKRLAKLFLTVMGEKMYEKRIIIHTEKVKAFGETYDALRVKKELPPAIESKVIICEKCGNAIEPMSKMTASQLAEYTYKKYKMRLCEKCATEQAAIEKGEGNAR